jgi:hypothetical protein
MTWTQRQSSSLADLPLQRSNARIWAELHERAFRRLQGRFVIDDIDCRAHGIRSNSVGPRQTEDRHATADSRADCGLSGDTVIENE